MFKNDTVVGTVVDVYNEEYITVHFCDLHPEIQQLLLRVTRDKL